MIRARDVLRGVFIGALILIHVWLAWGLFKSVYGEDSLTVVFVYGLGTYALTRSAIFGIGAIMSIKFKGK